MQFLRIKLIFCFAFGIVLSQQTQDISSTLERFILELKSLETQIKGLEGDSSQPLALEDYNLKVKNIKQTLFAAITGLDERELQALFNPQSSQIEGFKISDLFIPFLAPLLKLAEKPKLALGLEKRLKSLEKIEQQLITSRSLLLSLLDVEANNLQRTDSDIQVRQLARELLGKVNLYLIQLEAEKAYVRNSLETLKSESLDSEWSVFLTSLKESLGTLALALLASFATFFLFKNLKNILQQQLLKKSTNWISRLALVLTSLCSFVLSVAIFLAVLFIQKQWFLFGLSLILLISAALMSKGLVADFISQAATILNLGFVREGEKIIYNSLPFKIKSLGFICLLENPVLSSSRVRVPLTDLLKLRSFPVSDDDPYVWFPTQEGDYIFLDGELAPCRISKQTPEFVTFERIDRTIVTLPVTNFLGLKPRRIKDSFVVTYKASLSYDHLQSINEIATKLKELASDEVTKLLLEQGKDPVDVKVDCLFSEPASSSIDFLLVANCKSHLVTLFFGIRRALILSFVTLARKENLCIPFQTITVLQKNQV